MKKLLFILYSLLIGTVGMALLRNDFTIKLTQSIQGVKGAAAIGCAPGTDNGFYVNEDGKYMTVLPGWGNHFYKISTKSDSAQFYFNQGLSLYYSYHMKEATASFKEAARFDSSCAMSYWGQALAMGPTYNFGYAYKMGSEVPPVLTLMNQRKQQATAKENDLLEAMNRRYDTTDRADEQRAALNEHYREAMKPLVAKYPDDLDIKALYTDAVMLVHPWNFWGSDGTPKSWTSELVQYCKDILKENPHHPAGLHYYIHITEASRKPEVALPSADSLKKLFPGVAHMVHMSSHEYERIGYYAKGVKANEDADKNLVKYATLAKGLNLASHGSHYYAVESYCALSGAMYQKALPKTMLLRGSISPTPTDNYSQYLYTFPLFAMLRMGKWQEILKGSSLIDPDWTYASLLNDFAKGMASAKNGDYDRAENHLRALQKNEKNKILKVRFAPHMSSPYECAVIAENILMATTAFGQKKYEEAFSAIKKAILAEDSLIYGEPKLWMLPARQYFGAFLLKLNQPREAEKVYREDLIWNPGNGWSLLGLYQALKAQGKTSELKKIKTLYLQSFSHADAIPTTSAY